MKTPGTSDVRRRRFALGPVHRSDGVNIEGETPLLKPDPGALMPVDRAATNEVAEPAPPRPARSPARLAAKALGDAFGLVATTLLIMGAAALSAILVVRVGADLLQGIDPLASEARRPRLYPQHLALREIASDVLRQWLIVALVVGTAVRTSGPAWRQVLALRPVAAPGLARGRLALVLLFWPALHILWVIATAEVFRMPFGRHVALSPLLGATGAAAWLAFTILLAPIAEEVLMRGLLFERASRFLRPWGAVLATSALFVLLHLQIGSLARPVSLVPLAVMLGWLRWRTGRLWPCILLHIWSNLTVVAYVLWPSQG